MDSNTSGAPRQAVERYNYRRGRGAAFPSSIPSLYHHGQPLIPPDVYHEMGLNDSEYRKIEAILGREPSETELGMFAVMWSEHCGYKYSRPVLALFKTYKEALEGKGFENAGIVDIGDGIGVTMKGESHNHPSAVEPYQGAATGVGGIIRDILTMGT